MECAQDHLSEHERVLTVPLPVPLQTVECEPTATSSRPVSSNETVKPPKRALKSIHFLRLARNRLHEYLPVIQDDPEQRCSTSTTHPERPISTLTTRSLGVRRSNSLIRSLSPSPALITHSSPLSSLPAQRQPDFYNPHQYLLGSDSAIAEPDLDGDHDDDDLDHNNDHANDHDNEHEVQLQALPSQMGINGEPRLTSAETARLAATFCIVWFGANWTVNASLGLTSVGSSTVLAGMSGEFRGVLRFRGGRVGGGSGHGD
jgi:hypothetical protein